MSYTHILRWKVAQFSFLSIVSDQQHPKPVIFSLFILENISKQNFFQGISHLEIPKSYSTM